jgi:NADH-quinone oxidoreductase subunit E
MLSENARKKIEGSLAKYPDRKSAVMDALRIAQAERGGHLTTGDMQEIALLLGMQPVEVNAVARFYTMYNVERPVGRHHVQVCRNLSCVLRGAEKLIERMERALNIKTGETTPDKRVTLSTVECLGSCGTAPMMQINDDYHEDLTEGRVDEILKALE